MLNVKNTMDTSLIIFLISFVVVFLCLRLVNEGEIAEHKNKIFRMFFGLMVLIMCVSAVFAWGSVEITILGGSLQ